MRKNQQALLWLAISILAPLTLSSASMGQASADADAASPVITDWSNHHVIFSNPATPEQAERLQQDPRWQQQHGRSPATDTSQELAPELQRDSPIHPHRHRKLHGDWAENMGGGASVGAVNYPAKFTFSTTVANCGSATQPDFVIYGTGLAGSGTQASIVAYDNIYSGCTGTVPSVYWAFNTGGTVVTSPIFSKDGTQVAFVQSGGGFPSTLVLLKWAASSSETVSSPLTLTRTLLGSYPTCVAPCMTTLTLTTAGGIHERDSNSSVFYDYAHDIAYVGDDVGLLHKYTPLFKGVPAQVLTSGWPVQVNLGSPTALNDPVQDFATGNVFVTDKGGFLYRVDPTAVVTTSGQLDFSTLDDGGPGLVQGPVVHSGFGVVYVFVPSDGSTACGGAACSTVNQLSTSFASGNTGSKAVVGSSTVSGSAPSPFYIGAFDSTYQDSVSSPTGNLYVCGNTGGSPALYQIAIQAGAFGTITQGPTLSASMITPCSPVADVFNPSVSGGATEWIFASVQAGGLDAACGSGCIFNFKDTPWQPSTVYAVGQEIIDSNFQIQVVKQAGTSGGTAPVWSTSAGGVTIDGSVRWLNQGTQSVAPSPWVPNFGYVLGEKILDASGNVQLVTTAGMSGGTTPSFSTTPGAITTDNTVRWTNVGALATAALPAAGGTSGITWDNTVGSGTLTGASQVYFSTLSNQVCGSSGTGGCAVQASQSALQ